MHISVAKLGGEEELLTVEIAADLTIKDLKAVIEAESDFGIQAEQMSLYHDGKIIAKELHLCGMIWSFQEIYLRMTI